MIACLPASPGYAWVSRIDWMISRALRSYVLPSNAAAGRSRARTSCWVMVEAPRGLPATVSSPAETMPAGSKPALHPEILVLDGGRRVEDLARQLVECDELALQVAEARQLDLAGPVVDDRLLFERDVGERRDRVGETLRVIVVGAHGHDRAAGDEKAAGREEDDEEDEEDPTDDRAGPSLRSALERPSMALAPSETGLHLRPHDSIGGMNSRMAPGPQVETARRERL